MVLADQRDETRPPATPGPSRPSQTAAAASPGAEDVGRPGDGHLSGVESLCIGESQ